MSPSLASPWTGLGFTWQLSTQWAAEGGGELVFFCPYERVHPAFNSLTLFSVTGDGLSTHMVLPVVDDQREVTLALALALALAPTLTPTPTPTLTLTQTPTPFPTLTLTLTPTLTLTHPQP